MTGKNQRKKVASGLSAAVLEKIQTAAVGMPDTDERSALGMVRSWVEHGRLDTWSPVRHKDMIQVPNRDRLAQELVTILEGSGASKDEQIAALGDARAWVNAPYYDPRSNGARTEQALLKPKAAKKASEKAE